MDISESVRVGMSFRCVPWRLSNDALASALGAKLRWLRADAQGQLFQGECLQRAMRQCQALDVTKEDVDMMLYLGMYGADCGCDWCADRRIKHARELESLPSPPRDDPAPDQVQNHGRLQFDARIRGYSRLSDSDARPQDNSVLESDAQVRRFKSERYAVRKPIQNDMLMRLNCGKPSVDAFADAELHVCDRWWGPGSGVEDSLKVSWKEERLLWCNPPWSLLKQTVLKIIEEKLLAVLICPHWPSEE